MATLSFYHVQEGTPAAVDNAACALLAKLNQAGKAGLLVVPTPDRLQRLDEALWGMNERLGSSSFLPHAALGQGVAETQPLLLISTEETPEAAAHLTANQGPRLPVVLAGAEAALTSLLAAAPAKIFYLFSANPTEVTRARALYKTYKTEGHTLHYYAQEGGAWLEK